MADRSGQQFGNYRLLHRLGSGGFAEVYLAEHIYLKRQVAVKVLHLELAQQEFPGFLQEAQTIARLKHPNIISVSDFGIDGVPFLVMDYLPHGSLREHHPFGTILPLSTIVSYNKQIAEALQYAHEARVIHRDVKPANMLMSDEGWIILSDFGIATTAHRTTSLQTLALSGSPHYIAPEQISGKPRPASDQYSLAMVTYEWLCGKPAFLGEPLAVMYQQTYSPVPPLRELVPAITPEMEQVVLKALSKDPQQRFESVQAFAQAFMAAFERLLAPTILITSREAAQQLSATSPKTIEQWLDEGGAHHEAGRYEEALQAYDEVIRLNPKHIEAFCKKGDFLFLLRRNEEAIEAYNQALSLDPTNKNTLWELASWLYLRYRYEEAIQVYDQLLSFDPKNQYILKHKADSLRDLKRYEEALKVYDEMLKLDPQNFDAFDSRVSPLVELGRHEEALQACDEMLKLRPIPTRAYAYKGHILHNLGRHEEALKVYDEMIKLVPQDITMFIWKGHVLHDLRRYEEEVQVYDEAIRLNPQDSFVLYHAFSHKGDALRYLERNEEAQEAFSKAQALKTSS